MAARGKRKNGSGGPRGLGWFLAGLLLGVGGVAWLYQGGHIPSGPKSAPRETPVSSGRDEPELLESSPDKEREQRPRYDFFTVLPEMEVVVPENELSSKAGAQQAAAAQSQTPAGTVPAAGEERFVLQAGSFRAAADAEQLKARLALLGAVASIQTVTVNDATWHRVRIGPVAGAREADRIRQQLQGSGIDVLVMKASS